MAMHVDQSGGAIDRLIWKLALVTLTVLALLLLWFPLLRATASFESAYNEGWNTYWQQATVAGQPLFDAPPGLTIENYPPLSFHVIGLLGRIIGDTNLAGRLVALLSLGLVCGLAGFITAHVSRSRFAGWYAGLCPLVWLGAYARDRIAMNDPQLLGMVLELLGFFVYLRWPRSRSALSASAILFALSIFTKQNLIAFPIAVGVDLLLSRDWEGLCVWTAVGLAAVSLLFGVTISLDGGFFLEHMLRSRAADYGTGRNTDFGYLILFAPAVALCASWSSGLMGARRSRLLAIGWVVAHVLGLMLAFGHGVANNILFEAIVFDAIVVPIACQDAIARGGPGYQLIFGCLLVVNAVSISAFLPNTLTYGFRARAELRQAQIVFASGVDLLRARPGLAWCEDLLLCHSAGKPMLFDAYFTQDQIETGRLPECDILRKLVAQEPVTIEIGAPSDRDPPSQNARLRFSARFMQTLLTYYSPAMSAPYFTILVPSFGPWQRDDECR